MPNQCLLLALSILPTALVAQITFERTHGGPDTDIGFQVQQTSDGGYALFGVTWNNTAGSADMLLMRTDASGNELWSRTYGGVNLDMGYGGRQTADGGYVLCGMFGGFGTDSLTLIRTDAQGDLLWTGHYPGALGRDIGYSVLETGDGGFTVCGFTEGTGVAEDALLLHVDAAGSLQWARTLDLAASEVAWDLVATSDGGYAMVVNSFQVGDVNGDPVLVRCNAQGDTLWTRRYAIPGADETHGLAVTLDGGYILAGGNGYPDRDLVLLRADAQGNELWRQEWVTAWDEMAHGVQAMDDGGFIGAGRTAAQQPGQVALYLFRTDAVGTLIWERTIERGLICQANGLDRTDDGGVVVIGYTTDTLGGGSPTDIFLAKTDGAGYTSMGPMDDTVEDLIIGPNPAADRTTLKLPNGASWQVNILGTDGRSVAELATVEQQTDLDVADWSPGVYLVRAMSGGRIRMTRLAVEH
ncbi:MAG: T9SS type A sorting domain-containing protein [Flavobacteriales bacterium]|nr:T9SS type A sorting domain-containing protein [Flavobacteriales bacterium]